MITMYMYIHIYIYMHIGHAPLWRTWTDSCPMYCPYEPPGFLVRKTPGAMGGWVAAPRVYSLLSAAPDFWWFVDVVLIPQFFRFWCQLSPHLSSNLGPKSLQNRSKSHPKSIPTCILFSIAFGFFFDWSLFDFRPRFNDKSIKKRWKIDPKCNET